MCRNIINELENNNKKYISDIITKEDINSWTNEEIIFIEAPTGSGKSHFIKHTLSENNKYKRILILVNRRIIKNQSENELLNDSIGNITITTYQNLANKILSKNVKKLEEFLNFDYIICDEVQYFCEDSEFIFETDTAFDWVMQQQGIKVFMTATAYFIKAYLEEELHLKLKHYYIKNTYDFIEKVYFYEDDKVIQKLLVDLPSDEKAIYFTGAKKAHELSELLDSCAFCCSKGNFSYSQYTNEETEKYIEQNEMFEEQVLCTTKVMDTGINIKDLNVKHLIIDIADVTSIIQCIGRKRIQGNEKIIIYIKNKKGNALTRKLEQINDKLYYANILKEDGLESLIQENAHKNTYGNLIYDVINPDTIQIEKKINPLMYFTYNKNREEYIEMLKDKKDGFKLKLFGRMGIEDMKYKYAEEDFDALTLEGLLDKQVGIKMFKEEQDKFKTFLTKELFNTVNTNHGCVGLKTINSYFDENDIPFIVENKRGSERIDGKVKSYRYWIVCKKIYE
jgi:superfamily II DNA or RNA helicase